MKEVEAAAGLAPATAASSIYEKYETNEV